MNAGADMVLTSVQVRAHRRLGLRPTEVEHKLVPVNVQFGQAEPLMDVRTALIAHERRRHAAVA
jgi:hypothetical protein